MLFKLVIQSYIFSQGYAVLNSFVILLIHLSIFFNLFYLFIYLFLAVWGSLLCMGFL